jgi:Icc-related predicted phosphoesterase
MCLADHCPVPQPDSSPDAVRFAAVADLHFGRQPAASLRQLFADITASADALLLCGDLTDHGQPDEARSLAREIGQHLKMPVVAVLGNHDHESQQGDEVAAILRDAGVTMLDGDACEVRGVGVAGVKGFCGGFGPRALGAWGESMIKQFVQEAIGEALKLETALARVTAPTRIAMLHYSPVVSTVEGEPLEIYPFLGSSRLEEPLGRYSVAVVFHGHAHHGKPEGRTSHDVPVYNVSLPLLRRVQGARPFKIWKVKPGGDRGLSQTNSSPVLKIR